MKSRTVAIASVLLVLVLSACIANNVSPASIDPPVSTQTETYQTATLSAGAMMLTSLASQAGNDIFTPILPYTSTPNPPTAQPTPKPTRTARPRPTKYRPYFCDNSAFVKSLTIPDGTVLAPGVDFTKIWEIKNTGACTWKSKNYRFVLVKGDVMSSDDHKLASDIGPGETLIIPIGMLSPARKGTYTGYWKLQNPAGITFGDTFIVKIAVSRDVIPTPTPTP